MLPPVPTREGFSTTMISSLATGLRYPLSTLHERGCRRPCKTRFRLAGSAFDGRASNPLGHVESFQTTFFLSRAYPDASWAHARRKVYEVHAAAGSATAQEILARMGGLFEIEAEIRGRSPATRLAADQARSVRSSPNSPFWTRRW
ncbi:hypothetical protein LMTR3_21410 [Bradyrhizobium sp. LMTR 3]|nr:hypothetical protein LMTR3_21410 [Bradyrhizobium sp. LMTR 3]